MDDKSPTTAASAYERQWISRAMEGDNRAFERLVKYHQGAVRALLIRLTKDKDIADDLAQGTFLLAWRKLSGFRHGNFKSWLCAIAYRSFLHHVRSKGELQLPDGQQSEPRFYDDPGQGMDLDRTIDALPDGQRQAILLSCLAGLSHREIARITNWPLGTVKSHLNRAKLHLRQVLEDYSNDITR